MMYTSKELQDLREENSGYNPEAQEVDDFTYSVDAVGKCTAVSKVDNGVYYEVDSKTEEDFIKTYPRQVGILINQTFFVIV